MVANVRQTDTWRRNRYLANGQTLRRRMLLLSYLAIDRWTDTWRRNRYRMFDGQGGGHVIDTSRGGYVIECSTDRRIASDTLTNV